MKKVLRKSRFVAGILILVVVCLGLVLAGDVIVKEGTVEGEVFKFDRLYSNWNKGSSVWCPNNSKWNQQHRDGILHNSRQTLQHSNGR